MKQPSPDREPMKRFQFKAEPQFIEKVDREVDRLPEFEGSRSRLIRKLLREFLADAEQNPEAA
jgi:metal-responsive CopG/Arc/MetJ family transcriptional regulator